jgi:multiple sugar transport system permease protein
VSLWTTDASLVIPAIVVADVWQWTPFMFVLFMAALTGIGRDQRELAEINDTGPWRMFFRIVLPALWPALAIALLVRAVDLLRLFDVAWALTRGGPDHQSETLSLMLYGRLLEGAHQAGTAAIAFVGMLAFSLVAMVFLMRLRRAR